MVPEYLQDITPKEQLDLLELARYAAQSGRDRGMGADDAEHPYIYERASARRARARGEIGISAVRGGTIVGEHEVLFCGKDEVITLAHSATSREVFATGAMRAAHFMVGRPAGFYNMDDVINTL